MKIVVRRYQAELAPHWGEVLAGSKNGLFLFERPFIEYHGDRFIDMSLLAYIDGKPVAIFPVARDPRTDMVASHPGLTFGGVPLRRELRTEECIAVIDALLDALKEDGVRTLEVKLLPQAFANYPASELDYALWRRGFSISRRDLSSILPLEDGLPFNTLKRRSMAKARKCGVAIAPVRTGEFHALVSDVLGSQHGVAPVHSAAEMELLAERFPRNISIVGGWLGDRLVAGSMVFHYGHVWHTQYLACANEGRECGALDLVIGEIKEQAMVAGARFLSLGASTESAGTVINGGLLWQKESYGARSITHDFMRGVL
jgi:hypothetical protein